MRPQIHVIDREMSTSAEKPEPEKPTPVCNNLHSVFLFQRLPIFTTSDSKLLKPIPGIGRNASNTCASPRRIAIFAAQNPQILIHNRMEGNKVGQLEIPFRFFFLVVTQQPRRAWRGPNDNCGERGQGLGSSWLGNRRDSPSHRSIKGR